MTLKKEDEKNFIDFIFEMISNKWGVPLSSYSLKTRWAVVLISIIIIFPFLLFTAFGKEGISLEVLNKQISSVINNKGGNAQSVVFEGNNNTINQNFNYDKNTKIKFDNNKWVDSIGNLASWRKNKNQIILPFGENSGLLKYIEPISEDSRFEIRFKPLNKELINFVISIPAVYEIIIGDNDYQTITLKKSDSSGGIPNIQVPVIIENDPKNNKVLRPRFDYELKKGEEIAVLV